MIRLIAARFLARQDRTTQTLKSGEIRGNPGKSGKPPPGACDLVVVPAICLARRQWQYLPRHRSPTTARSAHLAVDQRPP